MRTRDVCVLFALAAIAGACGSADDSADDEFAWPDDDAGDSRTGEDGFDDAGPDDDTAADDYLAPWPQDPVPPRDYDESVPSGPLRRKAEAYDLWNEAWHQPDKGGNIHVYFRDETYSEVVGYHGIGDSCIWTGTYLGGQAMRYHVTGDPQARANVLRAVAALDGFLHVTGRPGFIARYWGSQDSPYYGGDEWCDAPERDRCHHVEEGPYAGDFWWGETSRDQYTGWFFGMALAHDLVDDEEMRETIRADVAEVLHALVDQGWWILDEAGEPTDAAPNVLAPMQLSWLAVGYHLTGDARFAQELRLRLRDSWRARLRASSIASLNRYAQYYGNNLAHTNWYSLLRLARVYFGEADYRFLVDLFETQVHTFTRLSHNPWFTAIYMGVGDYTPAPDDPYVAQVIEDLTAFPEPPNHEVHVPARDPATYEIDPVSVFLDDLQERFPFLEELMGSVEPQALAAFPVPLQCPGGFLFQHNPFRVGACGTHDPLKVHSGHDYLDAYWLASFHGRLTRDR